MPRTPSPLGKKKYPFANPKRKMTRSLSKSVKIDIGGDTECKRCIDKEVNTVLIKIRQPDCDKYLYCQPEFFFFSCQISPAKLQNKTPCFSHKIEDIQDKK
jgi:hypothetical protein